MVTSYQCTIATKMRSIGYSMYQVTYTRYLVFVTYLVPGMQVTYTRYRTRKGTYSILATPRNNHIFLVSGNI